MIDKNDGAILRMVLKHPTPWRYENGVIYDKANEIVAAESHVGTLIFDLVWTIYVYELQPNELQPNVLSLPLRQPSAHIKVSRRYVPAASDVVYVIGDIIDQNSMFAGSTQNLSDMLAMVGRSGHGIFKCDHDKKSLIYKWEGAKWAVV